MRAKLSPDILAGAQGQEAESILRACVHCGFCNATCPTYLLTGDELDGPRGRIYLIKSLLEGKPVGAVTEHHLDRCLTCRACETTCPSGVRYGRLVEMARVTLEGSTHRGIAVRLKRLLLRYIIPSKWRLSVALLVARLVKPVLPSALREQIPGRASSFGVWPESRHPRRVLLLVGCVQTAAMPQIDYAAARVFDRVGISLIRVAASGCCGAVSYHLGAEDQTKALARRNIDAWWPYINNGVEAVMASASGCGVMLKDYDVLLAEDTDYCEKAKKISSLYKDPIELLTDSDLAERAPIPHGPKVAFQSPCTLQHGLNLAGQVERLLISLGLELTPVADPHLCCGSAGTYSLLQPDLAERLLTRKVENLSEGQPEAIVSANVGCILHLSKRADVPVRHWLELIDEMCGEEPSGR